METITLTHGYVIGLDLCYTGKSLSIGPLSLYMEHIWNCKTCQEAIQSQLKWDDNKNNG